MTGLSGPKKELASIQIKFNSELGLSMAKLVKIQIRFVQMLKHITQINTLKMNNYIKFSIVLQYLSLKKISKSILVSFEPNIHRYIVSNEPLSRKFCRLNYLKKKLDLIHKRHEQAGAELCQAQLPNGILLICD